MSNFLHYKGYTGSVEFSEEDAVFHGKVVGIKSLISFEGDSISSIAEDFHSAVDEYLEFCVQSGKQPEVPFKGSLNVRIGSDLHRKVALAAIQRVEHDRFISRKLAEAQEYTKRPDAVRYSHSDFFEKARKELL